MHLEDLAWPCFTRVSLSDTAITIRFKISSCTQSVVQVRTGVFDVPRNPGSTYSRLAKLSRLIDDCEAPRLRT